MLYPTYYISSSVTNVDTFSTFKILMLPTASTIQDIPLIIRDTNGNASVSSIFVSTQRFDLIDHFASTLELSTNFQSLRVVPYSTTRYAITLNYMDQLTPYIA